MSAETFRENYEILQRHAQTLRDQDEPNIDDLLSIVTESVQAYKVCQARIEAVEKALAQALEGSGLDTGSVQRGEDDAVQAAPARPTRPASRRPPSGAGVDDMDDDVPF
ncbi:exodeoxyribonuclease VII small subunit [Azohydromonas australica]|uniref:exodeoxyribonuclease VII small subunit n=1 Tax=Azohydromonas australica TaxID=364039 RepID=UPI000425FC38|nr:exodeoxyribonuclease VII small subunit [Azohydromonas australica]